MAAARRMLAAMCLLALPLLSWAHTVIVYPGWRGNNLVTNDTFPYGMQWMYPCGGVPLTTNRTYWPTTGGPISFQPGWFVGHATAMLQVNLGLGTDGPDGGPLEMAYQIVPPFSILGPSNNPFPGTICLDKVSTPTDIGIKAGVNATIQVLMTAQHGAALFSCVDITFVDPGDKRIPAVNGTNCFNSSDIGFADIETITISRGIPIGDL
ncbi:hypothetical protein Trco_002147 [Trichoderma cornu-damae]|uniref:Copper acquisition factor BIM1-like domain-containing protein n=1 Tax=Trichoderma cornu-damae TaxID=654480 RepID=A0A9P8QM29_9HYPO|nr:hypothetical protein Trco_002147 [Trichoderma cornu-damae]